MRFSEGIIDRTGAQTMLYLTCIMISSVDLAYYGVSRAEDWISVDCGTVKRYPRNRKVLNEYESDISFLMNSVRTALMHRLIRVFIVPYILKCAFFIYASHGGFANF